MTTSSEPHLSEGDRHRLKTYHREFFPAIAAYLVIVVATAVYVGDDPAMPRRLVLLLPLLPALWAIRAIVRSLKRSDEFERMVQLEAMAVGFGVAMVAAMATGFVGMHAEPNRFNQVTPWIIFSIAVLAWGVMTATRLGRHR